MIRFTKKVNGVEQTFQSPSILDVISMTTKQPSETEKKTDDLNRGAKA